MPQKYFNSLFRYLALAILLTALVQGFKSSNITNIGELLDLNGHIKAKWMPKSEKPISYELLFTGTSTI